jgi:hypothetical protein
VGGDVFVLNSGVLEKKILGYEVYYKVDDGREKVWGV